jgi:hypothetical protein
VKTTRLLRAGLGAFAIGALLLAIGFVVDRKQAAFSFLAAYGWGVSIAVGALVFLLIVHVWRARWPVVLRHPLEAAAGTLPFFAVLFVVIVIFREDLYVWTTPEHVEEEHLRHALHAKAAYLNVPFFIGRAVFYFAAWTILAALLRAWALRVERVRPIAAAGIPIVGLTLTFASFDWLMSLTPAWYSTAYGIYLFAGGFLGAFCVLALAARALSLGPLEGKINASHFHAVGRLIFTFTVFWAYIALFQGFIIWIANKPEEVVFYIPRVHTSWLAVTIALLLAHFAVPFFILLSRDVKRSGRALSVMAVWQLVMHYVDVHWLVLPVLHPGGFHPHWLDLAAVLTVAGGAVAFAAWLLAGRDAAPVDDPLYAASLRYRS